MLHAYFFRSLYPLLQVPIFDFPREGGVFMFRVFSMFFCVVLVYETFSGIREVMVPFYVQVVHGPFLKVGLSRLPYVQHGHQRKVGSPISGGSGFAVLVPF